MKKIIVEGLKYKYPDTEELALNDISFEVNEGEVIGIVGRNGSGKSSLCLSLTGLIPHFFHGGYGGKVFINGTEVKTSTITDISQTAGLVFDNPFTQMTASKYTVYDEIAFGLENMGLSREEMIRRIDWSLQLMDIEKIKQKNPFDLSGGQMQRVAIASVIAMRPNILVLDEPTSQLDPQGSEEVFKVIQQLSKEGMTIVIAEHKIEKLASFADRILLLDQGKQIDYDIPQKVFSRDDLDEYGIEPPVFTTYCKSMGMKDEQTGYYPITLAEVSSMIGRTGGDENE
ncbi:energy-coupling factor ABC transporter ATP-binding protein [Bacillus andreraoultii]|uniref:energy-coupling factor ABC transporter ATP-binding protein n=1 Tax=Bacillus andreraoultii TaxID=1499685 RepID=UPI00053A3D48|nr:ABC transporter ATP-binding protein [Bacillus andreraoultii]